MIVSFMHSLGEQLSAGDETAMITCGNIEEMIGHINRIRDHHILPSTARGIQVDKLDEWTKIPLGDCILTKISEDGVVEGFSVRPEIMKLILYKEGNDLLFINKVIRTVN